MTHMTLRIAHQDLALNRTASAVIGVLFFVFATAFGAYIRIPVAGSPVPITLQTFFVLLAGAVLGRRLGVASQVSYIALGACGLPIFQGSMLSRAYLLGPTGGYLAGFILASLLIGTILGRHRLSLVASAAVFGAGSAVILACGSLWLAVGYHLTLSQACLAGAVPFLAGDIVKSIVAAILYQQIAPRARHIFRS